MKTIKHFLQSILFIIFSSSCLSQNYQIPFEKGNGNQTCTYDEVLLFSQKADELSDSISFEIIGKSASGFDIPMIIVDADGARKSSEIRRKNKVVILIQAGIHAGEPDGTDAGFLLIRDLVRKPELRKLLQHVSILFIPSMNPDGLNRFGPHTRINQNGPEKAGWRTNGRNLNLNRDYLKAESPEISAFLGVFNDFRPDFFIDCHTTDGADYQYTITYSLNLSGEMNKAQTDWQKDVYLPYVTKRLEKDNILIFPYVIFRQWHNPRSGLISYAGTPAFSQAYAGFRNRPGLLIETHMLKDYKTRVTASNKMLLHTIEFSGQNFETLKKLNEDADEECRGAEFRQKKYVLEYRASKDSSIIEFKGNSYSSDKSDLTGGDWFHYTKTSESFKIPYFAKQEPVSETLLPLAYIIPPAWNDITETLKKHGVKVVRLSKKTSINLSMYRFSDVEFAKNSFEGHFQVQNYKIAEEKTIREFPAGSALIVTNCPEIRILAHALEPLAPGSLLKWGYFNSIFEQKEYAETYVMEKEAREMIQADPKLKDEFEKKKAENAFGNNQFLMLNWFYAQSKYRDTEQNRYPVGFIYSKTELDNILNQIENTSEHK